MRIKLVNVLVLFFLMTLTGCIVSNSFNYEYEYFNNNIGNEIEKNDNGVYIFKSIEDVNSFKENKLNNNFVESLNQYEEEFFKNKYLVLIVLYNKTGSTEYRLIDSNVENEALTIKIKEKSKRMGDDSLINKAFIIIMDNEEQYSEFNIEIIK